MEMLKPTCTSNQTTKIAKPSEHQHVWKHVERDIESCDECNLCYGDINDYGRLCNQAPKIKVRICVNCGIEEAL